MNSAPVQTTVASQLPEAVHRLFGEHVPGAQFVAIAAERPLVLPPQVNVWIPNPLGDAEAARQAPRPSGWPFHLRWVHLISTGIDGYPPWLYEVPMVTSSRGEFGIALAEYALAAIFAAVKKLPELWIHSAEQWRFGTVGAVQGSILGIVGYGAIGEALAVRALALGMHVQVLRHSDQPLAPGAQRVADLQSLFQVCDHVVLAAPLTAATSRMIDRAVLQAAKPGLHLINVARGGLIDDDALLASLDCGAVALATLDCVHPEPLPPGHAFYTHPRVRLSPHSAGATDDLVERLATAFARNVRRFERGEALLNIVDCDRGY